MRSSTTSSGSRTTTRAPGASRWASPRPACGVDPDRVETNFVQVDVAPLSHAEAIALLAERGVGLSATVHPGVLRAVTHLDVGDDEIERALELIPRALGARVRA